MARAALGWSVRELAERAGVGTATVFRLENDQVEPIRSTAAAIQAALEAAGVQFIEADNGGPGVRLNRPEARS
jgi:transcriptional regulator with XRE-family HTH domain